MRMRGGSDSLSQSRSGCQSYCMPAARQFSFSLVERTRSGRVFGPPGVSQIWTIANRQKLRLSVLLEDTLPAITFLRRPARRQPPQAFGERNAGKVPQFTHGTVNVGAGMPNVSGSGLDVSWHVVDAEQAVELVDEFEQ